jgi:hypothetical protein
MRLRSVLASRPARAAILASTLALGACNAVLGIVPGAGSETGGGSTSTSSVTDTGGMDGGSPCAAPFPATPVRDHFDGGSGDPGKNWTADDPGAYTVMDGQLFCSGSMPNSIFWNAVFGATQEVYVTVDSFEASDLEIELILKNQGQGGEAGAILVDYQPNVNALGIYAPNTPMVSIFSNFQLLPHDQFGARLCSDGTLKVFVNGVPQEVMNIANVYPALQQTGRIGFYSSGLGDAGVLLDDFGWG